MNKQWYKSFAGSIVFHVFLLLLVGFLAKDAFIEKMDEEDIVEIVYDANAGGGRGGSPKEQEISQANPQQAMANPMQFLQDLNPILKNDKAEENPKTENTTKANTENNTNSDTQANAGGGNNTGEGSGEGNGKGDGTGGGDGNGNGNGSGDSDGDGGAVPKVPPRLKSSVQPNYPPSARDNNIEGTALVKFLVNSSGGVDSVSIASSSGNGELDQSALAAARRYTFYPAQNKKGNPVPCNINIPIEFSLE